MKKKQKILIVALLFCVISVMIGAFVVITPASDPADADADADPASDPGGSVYFTDPDPVASQTPKPEMLPNGVYSLKGGRGGKYCADEGHRIICDRPHVQGWEKFTITKSEQWPGKYSLKGGKTGKWCADEGNRIICNRPHVQGWELFTITKHGNKYALKGGKTGKYCADDVSPGDGTVGVRCNRPARGSWELFTIEPTT